MPKIQWTNLPPALRDHLFDRLREREISVEDLYLLKQWRESEPEAPDGPWCKDFGSFKICGEGKYPKTFLLRGQPAKGQRL
jgi:transposase InsO family protein